MASEEISIYSGWTEFTNDQFGKTASLLRRNYRKALQAHKKKADQMLTQKDIVERSYEAVMAATLQHTSIEPNTSNKEITQLDSNNEKQIEHEGVKELEKDNVDTLEYKEHVDSKQNNHDIIDQNHDKTIVDDGKVDNHTDTNTKDHSDLPSIKKIEDKSDGVEISCSSSKESHFINCETLSTTCKKLKQAWDNTSPDAKAIIKSGLSAGCIVFIAELSKCVINKKQMKLDSLATNCVLGGVLGMSWKWIMNMILKTNCMETLKQLLIAGSSEINTQTVNQLCASSVGVIISSSVDIILWMINAYQTNFFQNNSYASIICSMFRIISDAITISLTTVTLSTAVANAAPWYVTLIIMGVIGYGIGEVKKHSASTNQSVVMSIMSGITLMPLYVYQALSGNNGEIKSYPDELECAICFELLCDPVFCQAEFICKRCADETLKNRSRFLCGPIKEEDIVESLEMKRLIKRYRSLCF